MKPKWLVWAAFVLLIHSWTSMALWAAPAPTLTPLDRSTASPTPSPTPWPTHPPLVAPTWAPMSAGPVPEQMKPKQPSPWMSSLGLGVGVPASPNLQNAYTVGFDAELGSGLKLTDQFSLWLDFNLDLYNSKNDNLTNGNNFTVIEAAFWARYRLLDSDISPYFFVGPGLSYNEYRSDQGAVVDVNTGYGYIPVNAYEIDFLAEGGFGLDMKLGGSLMAFLQGKLTYDFTSAPFAGYGSTDSPLVLVPFDLGLIFGI